MEEEAEALPLASNGAQPLAPGPNHTLRKGRYAHVSWATASGVYLIGGSYSKRTSEKEKLDGSVEEGFSLKYDST